MAVEPIGGTNRRRWRCLGFTAAAQLVVLPFEQVTSRFPPRGISRAENIWKPSVKGQLQSSRAWINKVGFTTIRAYFTGACSPKQLHIAPGSGAELLWIEGVADAGDAKVAG